MGAPELKLAIETHHVHSHLSFKNMYKVFCQPSLKEFGDGHLKSSHTHAYLKVMGRC